MTQDAAMAGTYTILVAEDDQNDCWLFETACGRQKLPHQLRFVHDGEEAINYLEGKEQFADRDNFPAPDLLFVDLKMPRVDGFTVLNFVQSSPTYAGLPVVVLSNSYLEQDKFRAAELGAREYLVKSGNPTELGATVLRLCKKWLKNHDSTNGLPPGAARS
jgi:CheY-like chemotaxis protein